jgi:phage-related protein
MKVIKDHRVEGYLSEIPFKEQIRITKTIRLFIQYDFKLPVKYLKKINNLIWELRIERHRILFGFEKGVMVIVNIFFKKTQKTPNNEIKLAVKRCKQYI